jgi:cytidine deaminase
MIAVIGGPAGAIMPENPEAAPCGVCRQLIYEFGSDTLVVCAKSPDEYLALPISELLPHGFGPSHLV